MREIRSFCKKYDKKRKDKLICRDRISGFISSVACMFGGDV